MYIHIHIFAKQGGYMALHATSTDNALAKGANFTNTSSEFPIVQAYHLHESVAVGGISASLYQGATRASFQSAVVSS